MVFLGSLRELCLEKKELGLLLQNHFEYLNASFGPKFLFPQSNSLLPRCPFFLMLSDEGQKPSLLKFFPPPGCCHRLLYWLQTVLWVQRKL